MRYEIMNYDLSDHPQKELINYMRQDYHLNRIHLHEKIKSFHRQKDKKIKEMDAPYIIALQHEQKELENRIVQEIKLHPPTYGQNILGGVRTRRSEV